MIAYCQRDVLTSCQLAPLIRLQMNRITIGRSAMEDAAVARTEFEEQFAVKLDAAGAVYETSEERMKESNALLKRSGGEETLEAAKAGPGSQCSPRLGMSRHSVSKGSECASMTCLLVPGVPWQIWFATS